MKEELGQFDRAEIAANESKDMEETAREVFMSREMKSEFDEYKEIFVDWFWFSEQEFLDLCGYCLEWNISEFLERIKVIIKVHGVQKSEIMDTIKEIRVSNGNIFCNYVLIKRDARRLKYKDVKRVVDKWHAWAYITDCLKGIELVWKFDDAIAALRLALKNWLFSKNEMVYTTKKLETTVSDLWQALIDAGVTH